jgi:hypothetical protein
MIADGTQDSRKDMSWVKIVICWKRNVRINRRLLPSALAGIDRRLLLGSTVGSCWDRPSAFAGIDSRLNHL